MMSEWDRYEDWDDEPDYEDMWEQRAGSEDEQLSRMEGSYEEYLGRT